MRLRSHVPVVLAFLCAGCGSETALLVSIDGDLRPGEEVDLFELSTWRDGAQLWSGERPVASTDSLPLRHRIVPSGSALDIVELRVAARMGRDTVLEVARETGFVAGQSLPLSICFWRQCVGSGSQWCREGRCDGEPTGDGGVRGDADLDAGADGRDDVDAEESRDGGGDARPDGEADVEADVEADAGAELDADSGDAFDGGEPRLSVRSSDVPVFIPTVTTEVVTSSLEGPAGTVADVNLVLEELPHPCVQDLEMSLTSPAGTTSLLMVSFVDEGILTNELCLRDFRDTVLDDESPTNLADGTPPYSGRFNVEHPTVAPSPLAVFAGESALGTWILSIRDAKREDAGSLFGWGIDLLLTPE